MRIIRSPRVRGGPSAEIDQAESTLAFALLASITPVLLAWMLNALAASATGPAGTPATALRPLLTAAALGVHHVGIAILAVVALGCLWRAGLEVRRSHGTSPVPSAWAVAEAYTAGTVVAIGGLVVLLLV